MASMSVKYLPWSRRARMRVSEYVSSLSAVRFSLQRALGIDAPIADVHLPCLGKHYWQAGKVA